MWRWILLGGLVLVSAGLVTLGIWDQADLGLGAALFVAVLVMVEGVVRIAVYFRGRRRNAHASDS